MKLEKLNDKLCEVSFGDFFTQRIFVGDLKEHSWEYCKKLCEGKRVIHFGCSDYPFNNPKETMHIFLSKYAKELHGCDINGIAEMKEYYDGVYFDSIDRVEDSYDVILVPNIIEHLENPGIFVEQLFKIQFEQMFVLVPNYEVQNQATYADDIFMERVHPDHYAWYSPYTLWKLFSRHLKNRVCEMNFFDNKNMISILIK